MLDFKELYETNVAGKTAEWADRVITRYRQHWQPIIDPKKAKEGSDLILSRYDINRLFEGLFKDKEKFAQLLLPISVMEKVRNILVGERVRAGLSINADAIDPASDTEREADKKLLKNRKDGEALFTMLNQKIGLPPYKLSQEKKNGRSPFNGNVELFDDLDLDESEEYQFGYFFQVWHRLLHEMDAQALINYFFQVNEVSEYIEYWVNDILAKKAIAMQLYVDEVTGGISMKYLLPEAVYAIAGKRDDGKDAVCVGYEENVTVSELIARMGNDFDMNEDMEYLISAVNYVNSTNYTGVWDGPMFYGTDKSAATTCTFDQFLGFKVGLGRIEWKSWDGVAYKQGINWHGNFRSYPKSLSYVNQASEDSGYQKEVRYQQTTYKAFFIPYGAHNQRVFKFGKLYHQVIEGAEDEYSSYSIFFKKKPGPTVAEVAEPWIKMAQEAFVKFRWMVRKAKPKGRAYNYEALVQMGRRLIGSQEAKSNVTGVINMFEEGVNELYMIPQTQSGDSVGGGGNPNYDVPNGLDPTAGSFQGIIDWCVMHIKDDLAITQLRESYNPKPNDGLRLQLEARQASENGTGYIGAMIDSLCIRGANHVLVTCQDIVRYKDTKPYRYLKQVIGEDAIDRIKRLDNIAFHRYGITINSLSVFNQREKVRQDADIAFQNKEISYEVKMLVDGIDDYRKAAYVLAFEKLRADKVRQKEEQQRHENLMAIEKQKEQSLINLENAKGDWAVKKEDVRGQWLYKVAELDGGIKERMKQTQMEHEYPKNQDRTDNKIREYEAKKNIDNATITT